MSLIYIIILAVGLALDSFSVAIGLSLRFRWDSFRQFFRLSFHFGLFQFLMPIIGWSAGNELASRIRGYDHWAAFLLLSFIGIKLIREQHEDNRTAGISDPTRGKWLVLLSLATSIDALAVGLSLSLYNVSIFFPSLIFGIVAGLFTLSGMYYGNRLGNSLSGYLGKAGGLILIGIGVKILLGDLFL
ncbi:MAG: hypothetical protein A3F83_03380 [Candidatus Glassbacteria bacterium RIFCSPLOWO2_12_FULL_58_11]|uniref:Putative manganese efflux pump MntP n=2 Tax=Candidatus Glassiibacteriota TaxID=1817805 RepID=A0A1F5YR52_9BACT|nr:MAG: hypothetical protein A2Z86_02135 [Candidatus Glassbacteria bacterium GWA2_58_10]OGG02670.1 MAG: hypothetical protein A3F83_03380 [Candidatus Glassbacteria bacterium RIFCSPLOWO2_12_FULL_58_11]